MRGRRIFAICNELQPVCNQKCPELYPELVTPGPFLIIPNAMLTSLCGADPSVRPYRTCRIVPCNSTPRFQITITASQETTEKKLNKDINHSNTIHVYSLFSLLQHSFCPFIIQLTSPFHRFQRTHGPSFNGPSLSRPFFLISLVSDPSVRDMLCFIHTMGGVPHPFSTLCTHNYYRAYSKRRGRSPWRDD